MITLRKSNAVNYLLMIYNGQLNEGEALCISNAAHLEYNEQVVCIVSTTSIERTRYIINASHEDAKICLREVNKQMSVTPSFQSYDERLAFGNHEPLTSTKPIQSSLF